MRDVIVWVVGVLVLMLAALPAQAGYIVGWGEDVSGRLDVPDGDDFVAVSAGGSHGLALREDGSLAAWGNNDLGQCDVPAGSDFIDIASGEFHSIALRSDGSVVNWGYYEPPSGGLEPMPQPDGSFVRIDAIRNSDGGVLSDGSLAVWGYDWSTVAGNEFVDIDLGEIHSLALRSDGSVAAWGNNGFGACDVPEIYDFVAIAAGSSFSLGLRADDSLIAWGSEGGGVLDVPEGTDFTAISAGLGQALALRSNGTIANWGVNSYGFAVPEIPDDMCYVAIDAGYNYNLAIVEQIPEPASVLMILVGVPLIRCAARHIAKHRNYNT